MCRIALLLALTLCAAGFAADDEGPPLPSPTFDDAELKTAYEAGVALLEEQEFKKAKSAFSKIRSKAPKGEQRDAVERCILEASGGMELLEQQENVIKGKLRKAIKELRKAVEKYEDTQAGVKLDELFDECIQDLYLVVEDFEKTKSGGDDDEGDDEDEDEEEGDDEGDDEDAGEGEGDGGRGGRGQGGNRGGETGYGQNAKVVRGRPHDIWGGDKALRWRTGDGLSMLNFEKVKEKVGQYRYLNLTISTENNKKPQLVLLFDCEEGALRGGDGGRGGRRGGRGNQMVNMRDGFHYTLVPKGGSRQQHLRLDLLKDFRPRGEVSLEDVVAFRIIHLRSAAANVIIDEIRLEKE